MIFCPLYSGSSGNSVFVSSGTVRILIDAGLPGKSIDAALKEIGEMPGALNGIFITHEHIDHVKGVGVLSRKYDIPIYANELTWKGMSNLIGKIKEHNIKVINSKFVDVGDLDIETFSIPHDAAAPCGYSVRCNGKKVCVATDLGNFTEEVRNSIHDADVVLLESNHDVEMLKFGPYPYPLKRRILSEIGHLSNEDCGRAIVSITGDKHKKIILGHLSKTNNYPDLAYQTVINILKENGVTSSDITVELAKREMPSGYTQVV